MAERKKQEWIKTSQIAKELEVHVETVLRWIKAGKLTGYRFGQAYKVRIEDWEEFKNRSRVG